MEEKVGTQCRHVIVARGQWEWIMTGNRLTCWAAARRTAGLLLAAWLGMAILTACGPTKEERAELQYFPKAYQKTISADRYAVNPPDAIIIHAPLVPEVNNVKEVVAPDGTLNLDPGILGRVYVAGMSPKEIEDLLTEKLRVSYNNVKVSIDVEYHSQWYYVFGEAALPGSKRYTGRDTLVQALADAQITRLGWPQRIYVIKPSPDPNKRHVTVINLHDIVQRGDTTANVLLEQDDIVYIPLSPLAAIGVQVQNLLMPVMPAFQAASGIGAMKNDF